MYRRVYEALGCFPGDIPEIRKRYDLSSRYDVSVYIEKERPYSSFRMPDQKYGVPIGPDTPNEIRVSFEPSSFEAKGSTTGENESSKLYTEISCLFEVHITEGIAAGVEHGDVSAKKTLEQKASEYKSEVQQVADLVAGTLGLRLHKQFVLVLLHEGFVYPGRAPGELDYTWESDMAELLDAVLLEKAAFEAITSDLEKVKPSRNDTWKDAAQILKWLMRAWGEQDHIARFVALFIPLEMLLSGHKVERGESTMRPNREIRRLISRHAGEQKGALLSFYDNLIQRYAETPRLEDRFASFAEKAALIGWEKDIVAFGQYNRVRNDIVHRGRTEVPLTLWAIDKNLPLLEDLTERYIAYALYGDAKVYLGRSRRLARDEQQK